MEIISRIRRSALLIPEMSSGKGEPPLLPGHAMQKYGMRKIFLSLRY